MGVPGVPGANLPAGEDHIMRRLADLERAIREMRAADILGTAGLVAAPNKLTVVGELDVTGPMVVGGTLSLPAGIIDNAALTSPVVPGIVNFSTTGFAVTTVYSDVAATTIIVPPGCTQLLATCTAGATVINHNTTGGGDGAGYDGLRCRVSLNGSVSDDYIWGVSGSGGFTSAASSGSFYVPSLTPGAVLPISTQVHSGYQSLAADVGNGASINATLVWLR